MGSGDENVAFDFVIILVIPYFSDIFASTCQQACFCLYSRSLQDLGLSNSIADSQCVGRSSYMSVDPLTQKPSV